MNSKFNEKQIEAYASAFEEGDAVFVNGNWEKVVKHHDYYLDDYSLAGSRCTYAIKRIGEYGEEPKTEGFAVDAATDVSEQYRVTTLNDYKLQGGEKVIPMSGFVDYIDFGKVYHVKLDSHGTPIVTDNVGNDFVPVGKYWAVVPRYEQAQSIERKEVKTNDIASVLYKRYYDVLQKALRNNIKSALQENNYNLVIELSELAIEMEETK